MSEEKNSMGWFEAMMEGVMLSGKPEHKFLQSRLKRQVCDIGSGPINKEAIEDAKLLLNFVMVQLQIDELRDRISSLEGKEKA